MLLLLLLLLLLMLSLLLLLLSSVFGITGAAAVVGAVVQDLNRPLPLQ